MQRQSAAAEYDFVPQFPDREPPSAEHPPSQAVTCGLKPLANIPDDHAARLSSRKLGLAVLAPASAWGRLRARTPPRAWTAVCGDCDSENRRMSSQSVNKWS